MRKRMTFVFFVVLLTLTILVFNISGFSQSHNNSLALQSPVSPEVEKLQSDAVGDVEINWNPKTGRPSFIRGHIPISVMSLTEVERPKAIALAFIDRHADLFGIQDITRELNVVRVDIDDLGMSHVTLVQVYKGFEVYNAIIEVHLKANSQEVVAISSSFVPDIQLLSTTSEIDSDQAIASARKAMPNGSVYSDPKLMIYPKTVSTSDNPAVLVWLVELRDNLLPARNIYVIDANNNDILDVWERIYEQVHSADETFAENQSGNLEQNFLNKISSEVEILMQSSTEFEFFVILTEQADLSYAEQIPTKEEKGRYVYQTLWQHAQSTQVPIKTWLDSQEVQYQSFYTVNALLVKGDQNLVMAAAARQDVGRIEANPKILVRPSNSSNLYESIGRIEMTAISSGNIEPNIRYTRAPGVWALGFSGQGIVVGGQDTGYDWDHPALKSQYRGWDASAANVSHDYNWHDSIHSSGGTCGPDSPEPCDDGKHGTHTMGTALGQAGIENQIGMAPNAQWIGCRNMDWVSGQGIGSPSTYLECFEFFLAPYPINGTPADGNPDLAPDVTINSWGCPPDEGCSWDTLQVALESQRAAGIMTVVSAGNDGQLGCSSISAPPAIYDAAYTVGALETGSNELADFSSRGSVIIDSSNRTKPDIVAPGTNVWSSVPGGGYEGGWNGTSMAGPHVAGAVALLWSARPDLIGQINITEDYLNNNAIHITSNECGSSGFPNNLFGYGSLDSLAVVRDASSLPGGHRYRETFNTYNGYSIPGTLVRSEGDSPTGDQDVDDAHDFAGDTYDYYFNTHNRDSYDDAGASLISTANYGIVFRNAYWDGTQMVYGDGFAVNDVVAHELTHAVTEHSANLEYKWQSGALNESFSDIFGAMVDRDDWLMGEDLPPEALGGQEAIRDIADPPRFGQPDHTDNWVATCSDNQGVHTNSGITNKAYYNIATAIGKDKAELIFYRTLVIYLSSNSRLEDTHSAAIQSAQDLYGTGSAEETAVNDGFNAVGLDGSFDPPTNNCTCAATTALADQTVYPDRMTALQVAATLYRFRDELSASEAGEYYRQLYEQHTGRISTLLLANSDLRVAGGLILQMVSPGLSALMDGQGNNEIVTQEMVDDIIVFLEDLAAKDRVNGGGELADTIEREMARIDWDRLAGMPFDEAFEYINTQIDISYLYLPTVMR